MPSRHQKPPVRQDSATARAWAQAACRHPAAYRPPTEPDSSTSAWAETRVSPPPQRGVLAMEPHSQGLVLQEVQAQGRPARCAPVGLRNSEVSSWWPCSTALGRESASLAMGEPVQAVHREFSPEHWPASTRPRGASTAPPSATPGPPCSAGVRPAVATALGPLAHRPSPTSRPPLRR